MRTVVLAAAIGCTLLALACTGNTPTAPTTLAAPTADQAIKTPSMMAEQAGLQKEAISGTMQIVGITAPERMVTTPAGVCHFFDLLEYTEVHGDLEGTITFGASAHRACDDGDVTHLVTSGPFTGEITFQGRSGSISGQWATNCKFDASLGSVSCDGTITARGTGELDGVQFHFKWGPGWWPFPYTGTAFWK